MTSRSISRENSLQQEKPWLFPQYHTNGMIKKLSDLENELQNPPELISRNVLDRIQGSMIGLALGDAVGAHVEFKTRDFLIKYPVDDLRGGGTWGLRKGEFTDDTSMALCLASSLVAHRGFNSYDQLVRYKWWFKKGYLSSIGECFDIGASTKRSLLEFEIRQYDFAHKYNISDDQIDYLTPSQSEKFNVICSEKDVAGNGALMRLAPVPLFFYRHPKHAINYCKISARLTHDDQRAYDACRYYGALIVAILRGENKNDLLDNNFYSNHIDWFQYEPLHPDIMKVVQGSYKKEHGYDQGIRGAGYIVNALEAALWAFRFDEGSFEKGVLAAVNLGEDTDTTAAIYGQLAGAYYGYNQLPKKWLKHLYGHNFIQCLSKWIAYEGERWSPDEPEHSTATGQARRQSSIIVELSTNRRPSSTRSTPVFQSNSQQTGETHKKNSKPTSDRVFEITVEQEQNKPARLTASITQPNNASGVLKPQASFHDDGDFRRKSTSKNDVPSIRPKSLLPVASMATSKPTDSSTRLEDTDDVCRWIISLGDEYANYAPNFKKNNVDRFWLLHVVDRDVLREYGVENARHQRTILAQIKELNKQRTTEALTKTNKELS
ncbi:unnamed protein product [Rotaria sordida]|uniref:SAM domain-containing protein n=1 Tax=Rotaria sordida TaxID=392033 RepID=A0A818MUL6_9BILA|nr:unnamed protein product [Rotaria sordida]